MNIQKSFHQNNKHQGNLYLVPTPIGNLEDMTYRGVRILSEVSLILAEDTRNTIRLLNHYEIQTELKSFHEHTSAIEIEKNIDRLKVGKDLALVSDAGMPLINDPGHPLVQRALEQAINVIALPGANAALTALISSGLTINQFAYYGFFPRSTKMQKTILKKINVMDGTAIFYESPYRIKQAVGSISKYLSTDTPVVIGRELTKKFEEYIRGTAGEVFDYLKKHAIKGECVLMIQTYEENVRSNDRVLSDAQIRDKVDSLVEELQLRPNQAIGRVAKSMGKSRKEIYAIYHQLTN